MALSKSERSTLESLREKHFSRNNGDEGLYRYYRAMNRLEQIGLTIPPSLRRFVVIANWPRVVVDTTVGRQRVRSLIMPGEETTDPKLQDMWDANNMQARIKMFLKDRCIYGRSFISVGANERNPHQPLIRVESPRQIECDIDVRQEVITAAGRFYHNQDLRQQITYATLYTPDQTIWLRQDNGMWIELDRDTHGLGAVPLVMHLNRRMSGSWEGESEMTDIIPLSDSAARSLTDMQFAQAAHGAPRMFMTGVAEGDFMDANGKPIPKLEAYFNAVSLIRDPQGKVGQLQAADLKNFETAIRVYGQQASTVTGFPARYFGLTTANPPTEGAIRADEAQLVERIEDQNEECGMTIGWVMALALRIGYNTRVDGDRVKTEWYDPATPTVAQRMDAITKAKSVGILSREGAWDELGWSPARKVKEQEYFDKEAQDPLIENLASKLLTAGSIPDAEQG